MPTDVGMNPVSDLALNPTADLVLNHTADMGSGMDLNAMADMRYDMGLNPLTDVGSDMSQGQRGSEPRGQGGHEPHCQSQSLLALNSKTCDCMRVVKVMGIVVVLATKFWVFLTCVPK